ncbi:MAG: peptidase M29 [Alphaproteobacteria bacterium]|jgi:2,5-dihydroxypyridine 5,6-dioxygenase|nr:peptidase M29 [Alphaproteobacteria bacterium]MDP6253156.1 peptidase M29 [Alphaproteobacteria bacterium]MDP7055903.1 peptidase M29 [Alphaproteobacteria bacterium]MDP7229018.1 peptidase M29 [Alphaproteobacteria bacterium]MDP7461214.1 peptidase M29 [Alphaproteobacteria bacterium]|tara:strand:- start:836 stop:1882 length:1047 start_codon:yes stop_codon:yes gene_type:complete
MLQERLEGKWIDCFAAVFERCKLAPGEVAAILSESQSRPINVQLAELALHRLGAQPFHIVVPTPAQSSPVPVRSTGASDVIQNIRPVVGALASTSFVVDCTVEGLLHAPELPEILQGGARVLMISNEHPEAVERLAPDDALEGKVKLGMKMLREANTMTIPSAAGSNLAVDLTGAVAGGGWGWVTRPGIMSHWPDGLCLCFPNTGTVNGTLVLDRGDVNLTFKRYLDAPITLRIEDDYVAAIEGDGVDADLMRSYFAAWDDRDAYATSHIGWGMNQGARWDAMTMYDRRDFNGTELRAFAGNVVYSTGANEVAGRQTLGHFDLPIRNCTVQLDDQAVVKDGVLQGELA